MTKEEAIANIDSVEAESAVQFMNYINCKEYLVPSSNPCVEYKKLLAECERLAKIIDKLERLKEATKALPEDQSILFETIVAQVRSLLLGCD